MHAKIQPVQVFPNNANVLVLSTPIVTLGSSAVMTAFLKDTFEGVYLTPGATLTLTGDAYAAWGTDDEYCYQWAAQQLGLTIVEIVPDAPAIIAPPLPDMSAPEVAS
jgi:hypothetical protein